MYIYQATDLSIFDNSYGFFGCKKREVWEANAGSIGVMYYASHLALLVFHKRFVTDRHHSAHVLIRVLVGIEDTCKFYGVVIRW